MKRAAIYARVSTEEQTFNYSIENQLDKLRLYCAERGYKIVGEYVDAGFSGTTIRRPHLQKLMADARAGAFDMVVVYKLDRLFRSNRHMFNTLAEWEELGVGVASVTEPFDTTTAMGKAYLGMASTFAEWERNTIVERSREGLRKAVEKGHYSGGIVPYGYRLDPVTKTLQIDEEEAQVVRLMYQWLLEERQSCYAIAQRLNALGIPTKYRREGRGLRREATAGVWRPGRVYNILRSTLYKGVWFYGKRTKAAKKELIEASCPPIVESELWEAVQRRLKENNLWADRNARRPYLLRGLIKCAECGHSYTGYYARSSRNEEVRYYRCDRNGNRGQLLSGRCTSPSIRADFIESLIWQDICEFLEKPEAVRAALEQRARSAKLDYDAELDRVEKRRANLLEAERRLLRLYAEGKYSQEALDAEVALLRASQETLQALKRELEEAQVKKDQETQKLQEVERLLACLRERIGNASLEMKRLAIETLVHQVTIKRAADGATLVRIIYAFDGRDRVELHSTRMPLRLLRGP
jgi:site-specific DNA recombinase